MLTQLSTIKLRLNITDTQYDLLLTKVIEAVGVMFDRQCHRRLARTLDATQQFSAESIEIALDCYPVEVVSLFELKSNEIEGWIPQDPPTYLLRDECVISLAVALGTVHQQARMTYSGGYVLPGSVPGPGQALLPADIEHAAIEQVACWFMNREKVGLLRSWPSGGVYQALIEDPLLPQVAAILEKYERWVM